MNSDEISELVRREPWTAYAGSLWTGTDPETHGDELLTIYRPTGVGPSGRRDHAHFLTDEIAEYVADLHNRERTGDATHTKPSWDDYHKIRERRDKVVAAVKRWHELSEQKNINGPDGPTDEWQDAVQALVKIAKESA